MKTKHGPGVVRVHRRPHAAYHTRATSAVQLLVGLGLLVEHGLGLSTISLLLHVVTALALGKQRRLANLVLRHLVHGVALALAAPAKGAALLGDVHHRCLVSGGAPPC